MSYTVAESGSQYSVVDSNGDVVGTYDTEDQAKEQAMSLNTKEQEDSKEDAIRFGRRRSGVGDSHSGINAGATAMSAADQIKELSEGIVKMTKEILSKMEEESGEDSEEESEGYKDCGCETCKAMDVDCPDCPACSPNNVGEGKDQEFEATKPNTDSYDNSVGKSYHTIWGGSVLDLNPFYK